MESGDEAVWAESAGWGGVWGVQLYGNNMVSDSRRRKRARSPVKTLVSASVTGVGRSASTASFVIRSRCAMSDVTEARDCRA